jgi:phage portal protein BeeE
VATVINRLATVASQLPFFDETGIIKKIEVLLDDESFSEFLYRCVANYFVAGEFFVCGLSLSEGGKWVKMFVPSSADVIVNYDLNTQKPISYSVIYRMKTYSLKPSNVYQFKNPSISTNDGGGHARGFSILRPLSQSWNTDNEMTNNLFGFFKNRGANGVFVSEKGETSRNVKEIENDQKLLDATLGVGTQSGKVSILAKAMRYVHLGLKAEDAQAIETYQMKVLRNICAAFGVGSQYFGDQASSTYANYSEARRAMYEDVVIPLMRTIVSDMEKNIFGKYLQIREKSIIIAESLILALRENEDAKLARIEKMLAMGLIDLETAKTMLGL